jgi:glycosyltransferase involved in cell wall biosynthesis
MKVLYLVPQPKTPGRIGAYTFLDEEIQALAGRGVEAYVLSRVADQDTQVGRVHLVSMTARTTVASRLSAARYLVRRVDGLPLRSVRYPLRAFRAAWTETVAATVVRTEGIDLIHSHFAWPQGLGGALTRVLTGLPLVASLRGTDILVDPTIGYGRQANPYFGQSLARLLQSADRTVYFSRYMRDHGIGLGARPETTRVIRKGVDLSHFSPVADRVALRQTLGLDPRPMILTVAGLISRKGIDHLLAAVARVRQRHDVTLVICGDGPDRGKLESVAAGLGLADRVVFTGRVARDVIPRYFAACDVFALASVMEAAGNVLFEAMASARPIVCTDAGGPGEYVVDGQTGFVVPVADSEALASRIRLLLDDPVLADRLGAEGRRRTIDEFDYDRMVSDLLEVYREVLK